MSKTKFKLLHAVVVDPVHVCNPRCRLKLYACDMKEGDKKFDYVIYTFRQGVRSREYASDKWGHGTLKQALESLRENIAYTITGVWPYVADQANKTAAELVPMDNL